MTDGTTSSIAVGDRIEHKLLPGFQMEVLEIEPCDTTTTPPHDQYRLVDPEGREDWLCGHDVRRVG